MALYHDSSLKRSGMARVNEGSGYSMVFSLFMYNFRLFFR